MSVNGNPVSRQQLLDCMSLLDLCPVTAKSWGRDFQPLPWGRNSLSEVDTAEVPQAKRLFIDKCSPRQAERCGNGTEFSE